MFIYGAVLSASTALYRIYAPSIHALPSIEAITPVAEFQLASLHDGVRNLPYIGIRDMWDPPGVDQIVSSFYILGHSFEQDVKAPRRLKELNLGHWKTVLADLSSAETKISAPSSSRRIFVCGRRSSGLSTLVRCIFNRLLAKQSASSNQAHRTGVILLDLDTNMPEFTAPGMISLVHAATPLFGPSFTHLSAQTKPSGGILRTHFLGDLDATELSGWHLDRVEDLLDMEKKCRQEFPGAPVIVIAPKWLNGIDASLANKLWAKLSPTDLVCLDTSSTSPHLQSWSSLAKAGGCRIHQLPAQAFDKLSPAREHDVQMQSYFHLEQQSVICPTWNDTPILAGAQPTISLTYGGEKAMISAIILLGGHVALEDTYDALEASLVAVVAVKAQTTVEDRVAEDPDIDSIRSRNNNNNGSRKGEVNRTDEDLPRWQGRIQASSPYLAGQSFCLGLGIVTHIDVRNRRISIITAVDMKSLQSPGYQVALLLEKATVDGKFRMDWVHREMRNAGSQPRDPNMSV